MSKRELQSNDQRDGCGEVGHQWRRCCAKTITAHDDLVVPVMESLNQTNQISSSLKRVKGQRWTDKSLLAAHLFQANSNFSHSFTTLIWEMI